MMCFTPLRLYASHASLSASLRPLPLRLLVPEAELAPRRGEGEAEALAAAPDAALVRARPPATAVLEEAGVPLQAQVVGAQAGLPGTRGPRGAHRGRGRSGSSGGGLLVVCRDLWKLDLEHGPVHACGAPEQCVNLL